MILQLRHDHPLGCQHPRDHCGEPAQHLCRAPRRPASPRQVGRAAALRFSCMALLLVGGLRLAAPRMESVHPGARLTALATVAHDLGRRTIRGGRKGVKRPPHGRIVGQSLTIRTLRFSPHGYPTQVNQQKSSSSPSCESWLSQPMHSSPAIASGANRSLTTNTDAHPGTEGT